VGWKRFPKTSVWFNQAERQIYSSLDILSEYQEILRRDFDFEENSVVDIMKKVFSFVTLVNPTQKLRVVKDDPTDDMIIECALESNSKYIITYDKHLLKLSNYNKIRIIRPEEARAIF